MAKVVYVTPTLQFEVQQRVNYDESTLGGEKIIVLGWEPIKRFAYELQAQIHADSLQRDNTLEKYRVVDTFADEEGENDG